MLLISGEITYTVLGLNIGGKKELLEPYLVDQEGAHHWCESGQKEYYP